VIAPEPPRSDTTAPLEAEDTRLVQACVAREPGAWDAFVDRFAGLFFWIVDRTAAQRQLPLAVADRDDLVAEILLECLREDALVLRSFAGRSSLPTYLTVVARRVAVRGLLRTLDPARSAAVVEPAAADATARIADHEQVEALLGRLDAAEAQLVRLHHLEALSYGEISRLTGMPLGSIGPALSRARAKMRTHAG
jgi:RNA polymerase sigma-70 factor (ECF subfamily)